MPNSGREGRFIAVVGPSGVGKDSLMNALCVRLPEMVRIRRTITRAPEAGGEDYEPVDEATFHARAQRGDFALWWPAHGLYYGIPDSTHQHLSAGRDVLANLSRGKLEEGAKTFPRFKVLSVTAKPEVLARRLAARGRETQEDRTKRLSRAAPAMPPGIDVTEIDNSGDLNDAVDAALSALQPANLYVRMR